MFLVYGSDRQIAKSTRPLSSSDFAVGRERPQTDRVTHLFV